MTLLQRIIWENKFKYRLIRHLLFWIIVLIYFTSYGLYYKVLRNQFIAFSLYLPLYMVITYTLLYFIFPKVLVKKQYVLSILLFIILLIMYTVATKLYYRKIFPFVFGETAFAMMRGNLSFMMSILVESDRFIIVNFPALFIKAIKHWYLVEINNKELERKNIENKMAMLNAQLHPHFLFNTLNNLYTLALDNSKKTPEIIMKLSEVMRYIIDDYNELNVELGKEIEIIASYIEIEKLRYDDDLKITYTIDIPDEENNKKILIPPLLIFTFVENAFKHGASKSLDNAWINIEVVMKDAFLKIFIENSVDEDYEIKNRKGLGLVNVQKRLELYYPNRHRYSANKLYNRFKVFLEIKI